ncbi:hypothetical protein HXX01_00295, partial [Candidatus Nomurabacteria bacterium]|nr:hypothetical protein [Candidatus Nomurabacteria bacterium]
VYTVNKKKDSAGFKILQQLRLKGVGLSLPETEFSTKTASEADGEVLSSVLPLFFRSCEAIWINGTSLRFTFDQGNIIKRFIIETESGSRILDQDDWLANGKPECHTIPWNEKHLPSGFVVKTDPQKPDSWWPLTVADSRALPTPDELKNLTFHELIEILNSSASLSVSLSRIIANRLRKQEVQSTQSEILNPLNRVDSTGFILQRTRRMSFAIHSLCEKLSRPIYTREALDWRLYGPVGVSAFCEAMKNEIYKNNGTDDVRNEELLFFLAELTQELMYVCPKEYENNLPAHIVKGEIAKFVKKVVHDQKKIIEKAVNTPIGMYACKTFNTLLNN